LLDKYLEEVSPTKRGEAWERKRISVLKGYEIAKVRLSDLDGTHVAKWRDKRLQDVSGASVLRDWNLLSHACTVAIQEWKWLRTNPFREVKRPKESAPRQRVFTADEIERICFALGVDDKAIEAPKIISQRVALAFLFALETGCRAGEICSLGKEQIYPNHIHLTRTKSGDDRKVPLSQKAREILTLLPDGFGLESSQLDALFRKAKKRAGCEEAHFHDSRRTALTNLAKVFTNPLDLARVSGHKDLSMLIRVYYAPSVDDLAGKFE
jgi:integrase